MIDFEVALSKIIKSVHPLPTINRTLLNATGFVLSQDICARDPIPLFDSSAVDGFAIHVEDIKNASRTNHVKLAVQGIIRAGDAYATSIDGRKRINPPLQTNTAIKILTGSLVPTGAEAVIMNEDVEVVESTIVVRRHINPGENIRWKGEEFKKGDIVFRSGTLITPVIVGMLATLGITGVKVYKKPRIAIIVTGNELRSPSSKLGAGKIRDSNSYTLTAALKSIGIEPFLVAHVKDEEHLLKKVLSSALKHADIIITVGGVSVGDYDIVKDVFADLKVETVYWKIAIKPGKPNYFGVKGRKLCFGLPGNPVAAILSFYLLVKPAISRMMGITDQTTLKLKAILGEEIKKKAGRKEFVRGLLSIVPDGRLTVFPFQKRESHMLSSLATANCLIHFPMEQQFIMKGDTVEIALLNWREL